MGASELPLEPGERFRHNTSLASESACALREIPMKTKNRHRKSHRWRKRADSSPIAKGRRPKKQGRNPHKRKHLGGAGL